MRTCARLVLVLVGTAFVLAAPAARAADVKEKWAEALGDNAGPFGWLGEWLVKDTCKEAFENCKRFPELKKPLKVWPAEFLQDVLTNTHVRNGHSGGVESDVCIPNGGCNLLFPALDMITIAQRPEDKALLSGFVGNPELWKDSMAKYRPLFIRYIGWYGDKSLLPLVKQYAEEKLSDMYDNDTIAAAAWLMGQWGDKSLVEKCASVFSPDWPDDHRDLARDACVVYLMRAGDKSVAGKLKRNPPSGEDMVMLARAAMGDASDKAEWQGKIKDVKDPAHIDRVRASAALAIMGDAKALKELQTGLSGANVDATFEYARLLQAIAYTPIGAKALEAAKKGVAKLGNKERAGVAKALLVGVLLRSGDASVLKDAKALFASDDENVRLTMAASLAGTGRAIAIRGGGSGVFGGAPVAGLGAVLAEAWSNESDKRIRNDIAVAWASLRGVGGS